MDTSTFNYNLNIFMVGYSFLMAIFMLFKSVVNDWDKSYLYSSLMFVCNILFIFLSNSDNTQFTHSRFSSICFWFNGMVPIFQILFYREFFKMKASMPSFYKFITMCMWLLLGAISIPLLYYRDSSTWANFWTRIFQTVWLISDAGLLIFLFKFRKHHIYRYAVWSIWILTISFLILFCFMLEIIANPFPIWFDPGSPVVFAFMIDGLFFLFALTLQDREILLQSVQLQQQATANELKSLHSQMNPHFIFNALNSIKNFTLNNDPQNANYYLTKFSKLIRQVLENSRSEKISLKNELETLSLYLEIERLRAGDKFEYSINIDEEVEAEFVEIPPMLIQPYIENAIWHGLMPKESKGHVRIDVIQADKYITVKIEDDGIGRKKATELKSKSGTSHKSYGMKITNERLDILKKMYQIEAKVSIEDLETPTGTRITLKIPI